MRRYTGKQKQRMREALADGTMEMRRNHVEIAEQMLQKSLQALDMLPPENMKMPEITRAVDVASKLERLSRSEAAESSTEKAELTRKPDPYEELSTAELRSLAELGRRNDS